MIFFYSSPIYLTDASFFRGATSGAVGEPLTCYTPVVASTSFGGKIGVLTCSAPPTQSPSTLLSVFGICDVDFVLFKMSSKFYAGIQLFYTPDKLAQL